MPIKKYISNFLFLCLLACSGSVIANTTDINEATLETPIGIEQKNESINNMYYYSVDEEYLGYRKIKVNIIQDFTAYDFSNAATLSLPAKFQFWFSKKPFFKISDAALHSEVVLTETVFSDQSSQNQLYENCYSQSQPLKVNELGQTTISANNKQWSCELSGIVPNQNYWIALVLVDNLGNSAMLDQQNIQTLAAITSVSDQRPPPTDTTTISYFLTGIVFSLSLILIYLRRKDIIDMRRGSKLAHLYIGPALIALSVLTFYPIGYGIWLAFTDANQTHLGMESWIGLSNFNTVLESQGALRVTVFSLFWAFFSVLFNVIFGLIFALVLNRPQLKGKVFYRTILLLPWAIPGYISILAWKGMMQTDGLINIMLLTEYDFLSNIFSARASVIFVSIWLGIPFMMMSLSGALVAIPQNMYEAAKVEAISKWDQFRYLTLPNLKSTLIPLSLLSFIFTFNSFNTIFLLTKGGPKVGFSEPGATDILMTFVYSIAFDLGQYGLAAAWSLIIFFMLAFFSWIYMNKTKATEAMS